MFPIKFGTSGSHSRLDHTETSISTISPEATSVMAEESALKSGDSSSPSAAVHIVYTEKPQDDDHEAYYIRILSSVLGSEEAAKEALIYSYKAAATGFSAKLTPDQVSQISEQPGVIQVVPNRTLQLHSGPGRLR